LKTEAQRVFDFSIVFSYAVSALKYSLKNASEDSPIPFTPEHFNSRPIGTAKVRENAKEYKKLLSSYVFLSAFSFFEAYFHDLLKEVIEFHGADGLRGQPSAVSLTSFGSLANNSPMMNRLTVINRP
jgi:hypothetical protein